MGLFNNLSTLPAVCTHGQWTQNSIYSNKAHTTKDIWNQGSERTSSRLDSVSSNLGFTKQSLQAERKRMFIIQSIDEVMQCVAYQILFNPRNSFCFIAVVDEYLQKAYMLKRKSCRKTLQLILPALNIWFWLLKVMRWPSTTLGYPDAISQQGAQGRRQSDTDMSGIQQLPVSAGRADSH